MRIQMHYGSAITNPCAKFDYGEVEDYTVNLSGSTGSTELAGSENATSKKSIVSGKISLSPNPVRGPDATVRYNAIKTGNVMLSISDIYGRVIRVFDLGVQSTGIHSFKLNQLQDLSGNYFIRVEQEKVLIGEIKMIAAH